MINNPSFFCVSNEFMIVPMTANWMLSPPLKSAHGVHHTISEVTLLLATTPDGSQEVNKVNLIQNAIIEASKMGQYSKTLKRWHGKAPAGCTTWNDSKWKRLLSIKSSCWKISPFLDRKGMAQPMRQPKQMMIPLPLPRSSFTMLNGPQSLKPNSATLGVAMLPLRLHHCPCWHSMPQRWPTSLHIDKCFNHLKQFNSHNPHQLHSNNIHQDRTSTHNPTTNASKSMAMMANPTGIFGSWVAPIYIWVPHHPILATTGTATTTLKSCNNFTVSLMVMM